jgi:hypothetical protein
MSRELTRRAVSEEEMTVLNELRKRFDLVGSVSDAAIILSEGLQNTMDEARDYGLMLAEKICEDRAIDPEVVRSEAIQDFIWDSAIQDIRELFENWMRLEGGVPVGYK